MKIVRAVQTAMACPSQWDAWDEEGNYYYLRFRHGIGQMRQYKTENWSEAPDKKPYKEWIPGVDNIYNMNTEYIGLVAEFEDDDEWAGLIELSEFCERAGVELDIAMYTNYGEHLRDQLVAEGLTFLLEDKDEKNLSPLSALPPILLRNT